MKTRHHASFLGCFLLIAAAMLPAQEIIRDGRSEKKGIVVPAAANSVEKTAADELQYHLQAATGALLPIVSEDSPEAAALDGGYCLGAVRRAESWLNLGEAPACSYKIRFRDGFLFIRGQDGQGPETSTQTAAGTLFGVTDYLMHSLGVRWVYPGNDGEFIPQHKVVVLSDSPDRAGITRAHLPHVSPDRPKKCESAGCCYYGGVRLLSGHAQKMASDLRQGSSGLVLNGKRKVTPSYNMCISNPEFQDDSTPWHEEQKAPGQQLLINSDNQNLPVPELPGLGLGKLPQC